MKINYELLAICFTRRTLNGAIAITKTDKDRSRFKKHIFNGKTTKRRITEKEKHYGSKKSIIRQLIIIKDIRVSLINNMLIDEKLTMEENLASCGYTLEEAVREVHRFIDYHDIEVLYERRKGGYYEFRIYKSDKCYIRMNNK